MDRVILQVPMSNELKLKAEKAAKKEGFSSLQEIIRVILNKFTNKEISLGLYQEKPVQLSPQAIRRYNKAVKDIEAGIGIVKTKDAQDFIKKLNS